ncbi:MAG: PIG-L deacetylase family protein [Bacteroidota bacterium]
MQVLLLLAHADDETLGAGGTVQKLIAKGHSVQLIIVSDGVVALRDGAPNNRSALMAACKLLGIGDVQCLDFADQRFETYPIAEIANRVSQSIQQPDLIITHSAKDLNQDHRIVSEVARIIGRPRHRQIGLLACEIPCVAQWNQQPFAPQLYIDITEQLEKKIRAFECYQNEVRRFPDPYSAEGLRTIARFRGIESGYEAAEAFEVVRWFEGLEL